MSDRVANRIAVGLLVAVAGYFVSFLVEAAQVPDARRCHDIYAFFYPMMMATARSLHDAGRGFFWNPFQSCGVPLYGSGLTGILYPPGILSLFLAPDHALYGVLFFNLAVAGVSTYFLAKEIGAGALAAWCGALTFSLSTASADLITFTPLVSGPYAWVPAAMFFCERLLRRPSVRGVAGLAVSIALGLIPGHPQVIFYLYQLIALRVVWELATRRAALGWRAVGSVGAGLALGPLLCAVHLIPYFELMSLSIRSGPLTGTELQPYPYLTWESIREVFAWRADVNNPVMLIPLIIAAVSLSDSRLRRMVLFYSIAGLLCLDLALGPNGHTFAHYAELPLGTLFRDPGRFLWITTLCTSLLVALGAEAFVGGGRARIPFAVALILAAGAGLYEMASRVFRADEWGSVSAVAAAAAIVALWPRRRALAGSALALALFANLVVYRAAPTRHLLPSGAELFSRADLFEGLRARMSPQDRAYLVVPGGSDFSLMQKSGTVFRIPVLFDYDSVPPRRYAEFFTRMRTGAPMRNINNWIYTLGVYLPPGFERRLLDLTGARHLVVEESLDHTKNLRPPVREVMRDGKVRVYENPQALPRAHWVARIEVVEQPEKLLARLANGDDDLREVALVEEEPASGFRGEPGSGSVAHAASVEFVRDDPEHVVLSVHAPQRGFLFLADQHYPGWTARVNGAATPVQRGNYTFRLVEVPGGDSVVEFRYRPRSVLWGAVLSVATALGVAVASFRTRRPRLFPQTS